MKTPATTSTSMNDNAKGPGGRATKSFLQHHAPLFVSPPPSLNSEAFVTTPTPVSDVTKGDKQQVRIKSRRSERSMAMLFFHSSHCCASFPFSPLDDTSTGFACAAIISCTAAPGQHAFAHAQLYCCCCCKHQEAFSQSH
jgi:hypothetical protein